MEDCRRRSLVHGVLLSPSHFANDARVGCDLCGAVSEHVAARCHELALVVRAVTKKGAGQYMGGLTCASRAELRKALLSRLKMRLKRPF